MAKKAAFLDRDGTVNIDPGYISKPDDMKLFPGVGDAVKKLKDNNFLVFIVSNQSGVGRGYFSKEDLDKVHDRFLTLLSQSAGVDGAVTLIDKIYYCPHKPEVGCRCRKPSAGLIEEACRDFDIDLKQSYVVGDRNKDIELGKNVGVRSILVKTGYGEKESGELVSHPNYIAEDLKDAVDWIVGGN